MGSDLTSKINTLDVITLIEEARNAEIIRDIDGLKEALAPVWSDSTIVPNFDEFAHEIRGELFRLCGLYLTLVGRARRERNYQERAKNLLTKSCELFESLLLFDKAAEAKIILAFCYWNSGEIQECLDILNLVEQEFQGNEFHPVYLQAQINRLLILSWDSKLKEALDLYHKIKIQIDLCKVPRLKAMFHSESAIVFRKSQKFNEAIFHYNEAHRVAEVSGNRRFVAGNYNNIAMLYKEMSIFREAHLFADKSLVMYIELKDRGWIPHVLDTKALIYIGEQKFAAALETISQALDLFNTSEDTGGLVGALWTKTVCLLNLGRIFEGFKVYTELQETAKIKIGEKVADRYTSMMADMLRFVGNGSLIEQLAEFKKSRITDALIKTGGKKSRAAELLKIKHQTLSEILTKQFPTLYTSLGFRERKSRRKSPNLPVNSTKSEPSQENEICLLEMPGKSFSFDFFFQAEKYHVFYFDESNMRAFGIETNSIVAVVGLESYNAGQKILIEYENVLFAAIIEKCPQTYVHFITGKAGEWIPLDEEIIVGAVIGFCPLSQTNGNTIKFSRI